MIKQVLIEKIKTAQAIIIGAHTNPDGDAVGALVGIATLCGFLHIPYQVMLENIPSAFSTLLEGVEVASWPAIPFNTFISVDCGDAKRLGRYEALFNEASITINIDHHGTNEGFAKYNDVVPTASASCEIIYELLQEAKCKMTPHLAQALYTGILTDTGGFMHSCTSSHTLEIVAKLLEIPFDFTKVYYEQMYEQSETALRMEGCAIEHLEKVEDKCYITYVTKADLQKYGALKEDLGGIVSTIKHIKGCQVAAFLYPLDEKSVKVSFRSDAPVDVANLASKYGGGGHVRAAGMTLQGSLEEAVQLVKTILKEI